MRLTSVGLCVCMLARCVDDDVSIVVLTVMVVVSQLCLSVSDCVDQLRWPRVINANLSIDFGERFSRVGE
jgi:hypothetical protein